jgi:membrane protease YdiL (CAAX protease family)
VAAIGLSILFINIIASSAGEVVTVNRQMIVSSGIIYGGLVGFLISFLIFRRVPLVSLWGLRWTNWRSGWKITALAFLSIVPVVLLMQWLGSVVGGEAMENQPLLDFWLQSKDPLDRLTVILMAVVVAPVAEEILFRGFLYGVARRYVGRIWALLAASLLFAAIHVHLPVLPALFVFAVALTIVYEVTGSLWAAIAMHALFNGSSLAASVLWPDLTQ